LTRHVPKVLLHDDRRRRPSPIERPYRRGHRSPRCRSETCIPFTGRHHERTVRTGWANSDRRPTHRAARERTDRFRYLPG
jgi:hypothetical protein